MKSRDYKFWRFHIYLVGVVDFCDETLKWVPTFPWWHCKLGGIVNCPSRITFAWNIVFFSYALEITFWKDYNKMKEYYSE